MEFLDLPEEIIAHILNFLPDMDIKSIVEDKTPQNKVLRQRVTLPFEKQILWQRSPSVWNSYQHALLKNFFMREAREVWDKLPNLSDLKLVALTPKDRELRLLALGCIAQYEALHDPYQFKIAVENLLLACDGPGYAQNINLCIALLSRLAKSLDDQRLYQFYTSKLVVPESISCIDPGDDFGSFLDEGQLQCYLPWVANRLTSIAWNDRKPVHFNLYFALLPYMTSNMHQSTLTILKRENYNNLWTRFMMDALIPYLPTEKRNDALNELIKFTHKGAYAKKIFIELMPAFFEIISERDKTRVYQLIFKFLSHRDSEVSHEAHWVLLRLRDFLNDKQQGELEAYLLDSSSIIDRPRRVNLLNLLQSLVSTLHASNYPALIHLMLDYFQNITAVIRYNPTGVDALTWILMRQIFFILGHCYIYFTESDWQRFETIMTIFMAPKHRGFIKNPMLSGFAMLLEFLPKQCLRDAFEIMLRNLKYPNFSEASFIIGVEMYQYLFSRISPTDNENAPCWTTCISCAFGLIHQSLCDVPVELVMRYFHGRGSNFISGIVKFLWEKFSDPQCYVRRHATQLLIALIPLLNEEEGLTFCKKIVDCLNHPPFDLKCEGISLLNALFPEALEKNPELLKFDDSTLSMPACVFQVLPILTRVFLNTKNETVRTQVLSSFDIIQKNTHTPEVAYELTQAFSVLELDNHPIRTALSLNIRDNYQRIGLNKLFECVEQQYQTRLKLFAPVNVPRPNSFCGSHTQRG